MILLAAKFSPIEIAGIGLLFWLLMAVFHMRRNRRR